MGGITVLCYYNRLSVFYSLAPLFYCKKELTKRFTFTDSLEYCLKRDRNQHLLIVRSFEGINGDDLQDTSDIQRLRDKYHRVAFFDDSAGAGCTRFEYLPFVDIYFKRQLYRDRSIYFKELYGRQLYSEYYHQNYGIEDHPARTRLPLQEQSDINKLHLAWNQGIGAYPMSTLRQRIGVALARSGFPRTGAHLSPLRPPRYVKNNPGTFDVHARLGVPTKMPSMFFQRKLLLDALKEHPGVLVGSVSQREYNAEIARSKIIVSPFGWGEVCYRDFESILSAAVLVKPSMAHLETWPNVFADGETYAPISWSCQDAWKVIERLLNDDTERSRLINNARDAYSDAFNSLNAQLEGFTQLIYGASPVDVPEAA